MCCMVSDNYKNKSTEIKCMNCRTRYQPNVPEIEHLIIFEKKHRLQMLQNRFILAEKYCLIA